MPPPIIFHHFHSPKVHNFWELEPNRRICFSKKWAFVLAHFWPFWANFRIFWPFLAKLLKNVPNLTISLQKSWKKLEKLSRNQKRQIWPPKCLKTYPEPKMAPKMDKGQEKSCRFDMELPCRVMITLYRDQRRRQGLRQKHLRGGKRIETKKLHPWPADALKPLLDVQLYAVYILYSTTRG